MSTVRSRWTTLVLHTSSYVYNQKQKLLTTHAGRAFFIVISIIIAEVFLGLISLPLYLITKPESGNDAGQSQYKVRRVITLSILTAIFIIWIIKLIFILILSLYFDTQSTYSIKEMATKNDLVPGITTEVAVAPIDTSLAMPKISAVWQNGRSTITAEGTSNPNTIVAVNFVATGPTAKNGSLHMYTNRADTTGHWQNTENESVFTLPPGNYVATAVEYNETKHTKSNLSNGVNFTIHESFWQQLFRRLDTVLNIAVLVFIFVGVVSVVLML